MSRKNKIYESLRQRIITNNLRSGQQLYEKELMEEYGIGRTPLREIFHDLQREGLIEIVPKLGTRVVSMDLKMLRETVQLRRELEGLAAELATPNITPDRLAKFRELLDSARKIEENDQAALIKMSAIDNKIHQIIYEAADNEQLNVFIQVLLDKMTMYWFQVGFSAMEFHEQFEELELLYRAMSSRNAAEAKEIMKRHIDHFTELVKNHFF